jgi:hypothetical protein
VLEGGQHILAAAGVTAISDISITNKVSAEKQASTVFIAILPSHHRKWSYKACV